MSIRCVIINGRRYARIGTDTTYDVFLGRGITGTTINAGGICTIVPEWTREQADDGFVGRDVHYVSHLSNPGALRAAFDWIRDGVRREVPA